MSSGNRSLSPTNYRLSKQGFRPLTDESDTNNMARNNDGMMDIPLQTVVSHGSTGLRNGGASSPINPSHQATFHEKGGEHTGGHFHGRRKLAKLDSKGQKVVKGEDGEEDSLTKLGVIYTKVLNFSIVTRYLIYVLPVAALLAIPIIVGATAAPNARIGGVRIIWFFTWIEVVWLGLWVSKIVAHFLPFVFQTLVGVVSAGTRKYSLVIKALEIPLSLVGWAAVALTTFKPLMEATLDESKGDRRRGFQDVLTRVLAACFASTLVLFAEKLLIQLISINYHRKQFNSKIKDSKRNIHLLSLLYDASRALFPMYCNEFAEEDYIIQDALPDFGLGSRSGTGQKRPNSANPMRLLQDVGRFGDKITSAFGNVAHEITGKKVFNPNSAHSIVVEALEKNRSAEALARRIWISMVLEGRNALFADDIAEVLGVDRQTEAEESFAAIDKDGNGDISLDEMILTVTEFGRERKSIASSMHDVDQAIHVLDGLLATIVFVITIFIFIAFLNTNFVTTLATAGTALLSLSFVFAATTQEVLGSCIFLFVKHPYDVGDRIDLSNGTDKLVVEHISLLFTTFRRTDSGKIVQIPNIVLNNLWVENVTRSNAMRETVSLFVNFDTSFEDIKLLKNEMQAFVRDKENSRDFQPDIDIDVAGIAEMNKMELRCEIRHKSNWANGVVAGARRSKFMCALVLALRKVPIYGPGGGDAALGAPGNPAYSVAINHEQAEHQRQLFAKEKDESRLHPAASTNSGDKGVATGNDFLSPQATESQAVNTLSQRNPVIDPARDDTWVARDDVSSTGRPSVDDDTRTLLHKAPSTGGRRRANSRAIPIIEEPQPGPASRSGLTYMPPSTQGEAYNSMSTSQAHMQQMRGNAFAQPSTSSQQPPLPQQGQPPQSGGRRVSGETARPGGTSPYAQPPGGPGAYRPYGGT